MTICELLNIEYPIIQGGMANIADCELCSAVSNAGGLGLIGSGGWTAERTKEEILKTKELTNKPFGVNVMLMNPEADKILDVIIEHNVKVVTTGAGNPGPYIRKLKESGIIVIPVVPSVTLAKRVVRSGADAVVIEGTEAGGHIGELTTMSLTPQVVDAVDVPVIAAGGIADARGVVAAFALGASGVQVGTRFLATTECNVHENYKNKILKAKDTDTAVTGRVNKVPVRAIKNKMTRKYNELEKQEMSLLEREELTIGSLRKAVIDGDVDYGSVMAGQIAGLIKEVKTVEQVIHELFDGCSDVLKKVNICLK